MRPTLGSVLAFAMILGGAAQAVAQEGLPARGHVRPLDEGAVFEPCGTFLPYSVSLSGEVGNELANALAVYGGPTRRRVFVAMEGWMDTGPIAPAASAFAGTWVPTRVDSVAAESPADCRGEPPPVWVGPGCERSSAPDLECLPVDLVEADRTLARYVTEALSFAAAPGELAAAHDVWKRVRELRCAATRPGGRVDALWVMSCRVGMSRARLLSIWDEYLKGTETALTDPRGV